MNFQDLPQQNIGDELEKVLERMLAPVIGSIAEIEHLKRKINLTPEEVEKVYGLRASTLANKRIRAEGPRYIKDGEKVLYPQREVKDYLAKRQILTKD